MKWWYLIALLTVCLAGCGSASDEKPLLSRMLSSQGSVTLPFETHPGGYIFMDGRVNGISGKFMFDTGTPFYVLLNEHLLDLGRYTPGQAGAASSGQPIQVNLYDHVNEVTLTDELAFKRLKKVEGANFDFIEQNLQPGFLGFLGEQLLDVPFLVDYDAATVKLYAPQDSGPRETPITVIRFTRQPGGLPEAPMEIGGFPITASFDTGSGGEFDLTPEAIESLTRAGLLLPEHSSSGNTLYTLKGLSIAGATVTLHHLPLNSSRENRIQHYLFLRNFRTLWNFKQNTITLYPRSAS